MTNLKRIESQAKERISLIRSSVVTSDVTDANDLYSYREEILEMVRVTLNKWKPYGFRFMKVQYEGVKKTGNRPDDLFHMHFVAFTNKREEILVTAVIDLNDRWEFIPITDLYVNPEKWLPLKPPYDLDDWEIYDKLIKVKYD